MSTKASTTLGILDCDELAPELQEGYTNYFVMFKALLAPHSNAITFKRYAVLDMELPSSPDECDAYLITGSKTGVYDKELWIPPLRKLIDSAYRKNIKLIGICFGHQLLADTIGGKAEKSQKGWGIGALTTRPGNNDLKQVETTLLYSHQDQVTQLPPGAKITQSSNFCPIAGFSIPHKVITYQGHPEFTPDYSRQLMTLRKNRYAEGQYESALSTLSKPLDNEKVAREIIQFISTQVITA